MISDYFILPFNKNAKCQKRAVCKKLNSKITKIYFGNIPHGPFSQRFTEQFVRSKLRSSPLP